MPGTCHYPDRVGMFDPRWISGGDEPLRET